MRVKNFFYKNIYSIFMFTVIIISSLFFLLAKISLDNMISISPNLYKEVKKIMIMTGCFTFIIILISSVLVYSLRKTIVEFSDKMCETIDSIIEKKEDIIFEYNEDTLLSKIQQKLKRLVEILNNDRNKANIEKENIKTLISDISHQIKTPIANISMYNETLIERELSKEQQIMCLSNMKSQVSKLDWLVKALIKMSRLENNIISLNKSCAYIKDTVATALSGVYLKAEEKDISITVECSDNIKLNHDKKWTSEALFNILENAVKYSNAGGKIDIVVEQWELFTKIDISDTGIGISEQDINKIFKRFYRCSDVQDIEGVGVGLYLANEIITKQGGYIKVTSKKSKGTTFSVFLQNLE